MDANLNNREESDPDEEDVSIEESEEEGEIMTQSLTRQMRRSCKQKLPAASNRPVLTEEEEISIKKKPPQEDCSASRRGGATTTK